jgi:hypothetical protein
MAKDISFKALHSPFPAEDIEWRVQSCGEKNKKPWAIVLAYVTSRAIQDRLDDICKPENWQLEIKPIDGGYMAGIGIRYDGEWVWKWDGAQKTDIEPLKGGISGAVKRAAVHWGIGRYLYNLKATFADISDRGDYKGKTKEGTHFKWNPPKLPVWALPEGHKNVEREEVPEEASSGVKTIEEVVADIHKCTSKKHLKNIYDKYVKIFEGEDKTTLIRAKDVKKGELE